MTNKPADILFQLIHSLEKAEKRHFKLYIKRSSSNENLKIVQLFDAIDKLKTYNENELLKKLPGTQKGQLHNLKKHLYKQILSSLRLLKSTDSVDLQLNELFDHAHILYKKGLFYQSLRILEKAKETARAHQKLYFLSLVLGLEKRIQSQHITKQLTERAAVLSDESVQVSQKIDLITRLSNLALQLYSWHVQHGPVCTPADEKKLDELMQQHHTESVNSTAGFYEQLYLFQSYTWYALLRLDFLKCYRNAQNWVQLFHQNPYMKRVETSHYIKGLHYLMTAHFELQHYRPFMETLVELEAFAQTPRVQENDNFRVQSMIYLAQARMNLHFMQGTFRQGLALVHEVEEQLKENALFIDQHRVLVLTYKMGLFYFACGEWGTSIDYAQKIINDAIDLRSDLQGHARLLHLLAHYESGNVDLMEYLAKSAQRFISKNRNLSNLERELLRLLSAAPTLTKAAMRQRLATLYDMNKKVVNTGTARATSDTYLLLWIESKVEHQTIAETIQKHFSTRSVVRQTTKGKINI